jgi:ribokinase
MRVAVIGHVEWVDFVLVERLPRPGEITHARELFGEPAGGGAVAAVQLARLAGEAVLVTALGPDEYGRRTRERLDELGVRVLAAERETHTRRALTFVDRSGERTIVTLGARLEPSDADELPWNELEGMDAIYFTAGDLGSLRIAREAARVLVASPRGRSALGQGVTLDALVLSDDDAIEQHEAANTLDEARLRVFTQGERGGYYTSDDADARRWEAVALPGRPVDSYGCGDSFAAGLTYGLGAGMPPEQAVVLGARCGAVCLTGRGPYERQLSAAEVES